ncbi:cyclic nucleotide-binding domain-containing protein [Chloroflexus aggregans]|uniref:Cyclic nucleotide-binding protein n=1 Tax=Chloroflexus aggregans (strain MD-66 / DSM 9485) TaxID=326427 RepID=B8G4I6_CHLAD|nr:cyclic nucleotide-binding domain-containing protein [Chloroflexus aggregans]ACL25462.1 cyclic nucleotide-binding protein [Chloroflexus aggregans DSM 9485]
MKPVATDRVRNLPNDIYFVKTAVGDVLVNSPPESLKFLLAHGLTPPTYVLLPPDAPAGSELGSRGFVRRGINYASVEFLIYAGFFGQRRRITLITVTQAQAERLSILLRETFSGPPEPSEWPNDWLKRECEAVAFYPPLGRVPTIDDMIKIVSLEAGGGDLGPTQIVYDDDTFLFLENGQEVARIPTAITSVALPLTVAPPQPLLRQTITLQFIGGSDGFDPTGITTCFLAYLGTGQPLLFDAAAYLNVRLAYLGLSPRQIDLVVISHLHEDHIAGLPELILTGGKRVRLVTAQPIYRSLLRVLGAMLDLAPAAVAELFDFFPLDPGHALEVNGYRFEATYAVHSIPTIAVRVGGIGYSGDMRYDEAWLEHLYRQGQLSATRLAELRRFAEGAEVLVHDMGGGAVHTTPTAQLLRDLSTKSRRLVLAHTSRRDLEMSRELAERVEIAGSGHIVGIGEVVVDDEQRQRFETLTICPIFARLPVHERADVAARCLVVTYPAKTMIAHEGDESDGYAYVIHRGVVEIIVANESVRFLGRGNSMGERGALIGEPRTSTMLAHSEVELLQIPPDVFAAVADRLGLHEAFARAEWLWQQPALAALPWATLLDLALDFTPQSVAAGTTLCRKGKRGTTGYMLVSGRLAFHNGTTGESARAGDCFGMRSVLRGEPYRLTVTAVTDSVVWEINAAALQRFYLNYPDLLLHLQTIDR